MTVARGVVIAALCGFVALSYEILWFRVYSYSTGSSPITFGLLLGIYLAGLAVGGDFGGRICGTKEIRSRRFRSTALFSLIFLATFTSFLIAPMMANAAAATLNIWVPLLGVAVASALFGSLLPLLGSLTIEINSRAGPTTSYLYSANIVGSCLGSLLTGFVLVEYFTTTEIALFLSLTGLVPLLPILGREWNPGKRLLVVASILGIASIFSSLGPRLFDRLYEKLQYKNLYSGQRFARLVENRHGVIAVTDSGVTFGGGAYDGRVSTNLLPNSNGIERAYAVSVLHPEPRRVLMIGLSTGAWAQVIANSPYVDSLTIIEINPGYLDIIRGYPQVASVLLNPKVKIIIDDGRRWLVHNPQRQFDFIVSNTTFHYRANTTNLLSVEFMFIVKSHLRPGGVFHFNTTGSQDAFLTGFMTFKYGLRVRNFATVSDVPIRFDSRRWKEMLMRYTIDGKRILTSEADSGPADVEELLRFGESLGSSGKDALESRRDVLLRIPAARTITDDNMLPEWHTLVF